MSSQTVKLHPSDLVVTGIVRRTAIPFKHKKKRIIENLNPHRFYVKVNNEIVSRKTPVYLTIHYITLASANGSFRIKQTGWSKDGIPLEDIIKILVEYCNGCLPVNILTNHNEMASILNYAIKNSITESTFTIIPNEALSNRKGKPKIKVWCLHKKGPAVVTIEEMVKFYNNYPNNRCRPTISITKQHPYLKNSNTMMMMMMKKKKKNKKQNKKNSNNTIKKTDEKILEDTFNGGTESCVSTYSFVGQGLYDVYKYLKLLSPNQTQDNFQSVPVIHIDMANIGDNTLSSLFIMTYDYLFGRI